MQHATVHNFTDDSELECAMEWLTRNGMFVNSDEFKALILAKKEQTTQMKS